MLYFNSETITKLMTLDLHFYRNSYTDLNHFPDDILILHYGNHGYREGRQSHPHSLRENFITKFNSLKTLEIGPFANPTLTHNKVKYFDVLNTSELRARAIQLGLSTSNLPLINYVSKDGNLDVVDEKFELVFSSHNLEHQPDLITHLNKVSSLLTENGSYAMIIPNARYCFDASLPLSKISDIFNAHYDKRKVHTIGSVIDHRALTTHNHVDIHWTNSNKPFSYELINVNKIQSAINEYEAAKGAYVDVHCWQFEPHTLSNILKCLIELKAIKFSSVVCYGPVFGRNEFCIELKV